MNHYLKSSHIKLYPSAFRDASINPESYLLTEHNLTQSKALSTINTAYSYENNDNLILVINGYTFEFSKANLYEDLSYTNINVYAHIRLISHETRDTNDNIVYENLILSAWDGSISLDNGESDDFEGLYFSENSTESNATNSIQVVSNGTIVTQPFKLDTSEISNNGISEPIKDKFTTNDLSANSITTNDLRVGSNGITGVGSSILINTDIYSVNSITSGETITNKLNLSSQSSSPETGKLKNINDTLYWGYKEIVLPDNTQVLSNKTLTSPVINSATLNTPTINSATLNTPVLTSAKVAANSSISSSGNWSITAGGGNYLTIGGGGERVIIGAANTTEIKINKASVKTNTDKELTLPVTDGTLALTSDINALIPLTSISTTSPTVTQTGLYAITIRYVAPVIPGQTWPDVLLSGILDVSTLSTYILGPTIYFKDDYSQNVGHIGIGKDDLNRISFYKIDGTIDINQCSLESIKLIVKY